MNRTIIITGGNAGLGFETARLLAGREDTEIVVACRNAELGKKAVADLHRMGERAMWMGLDLASQDSIRGFVEMFRKANLPRLFALICNAGTQNVASPTRVAEGYETTFAVNHLGHYQLSRLLLDDLHEGAASPSLPAVSMIPLSAPACLTLAISMPNRSPTIFPPGRREGLHRYSTSKLCNVLFGYELAERLRVEGNQRLASIRVNLLDPGRMPATGLARSFPPHLQWISRHILPLLRFIMPNVHRPEVSAQRVLDITLGDEAEPGGRNFSDGRAVRSSEDSYDDAKRHDLWITSARMTHLPVEITTPQESVAEEIPKL